jgi:hypothetical protein
MRSPGRVLQRRFPRERAGSIRGGGPIGPSGPGRGDHEKQRVGPRGPEHQKSTSGWHHTRPVGEVRRTGPSKKGRLVRADQRARNLRNRVPGVPSGVPCGEGRIEDEAAGRIEGRAALVTP